MFTVYKYKMTWTLNFDRIKKLKKVCCQAIAYEFHMFLENAIFFSFTKFEAQEFLKKYSVITIVILQIDINRFNQLIHSL